MNFLAHLFLSDPAPEAMLGNLAADFIKGRKRLEALPPGVREGVLFHRRLDAFTDSHPEALRGAELFRPRWGRAAPILVDVYYDHLLARSWDRYCPEPLRDFLDRRHAAVRGCAHLAGEEAAEKIGRIIDADLMMSCISIDGIEAALARISGRLQRGHWRLEESAREFEPLRPALAETFEAFMPEAIAFARGYRPLTPTPS